MRPTANFALHSVLAAALIALATTSAAGAIYIKYDSIKGDVAVKDGKVGDGWIEIDSYQWGAARDLTGAAGSAANREGSSPSVSETAVTKESDTSSAKLMKPLARGSLTLKMQMGQCVVGARHPTATLDTPYMRYEMENVIVSSCSAGSGGTGGGSLPMEEISFNYDKISTAYTKQDKQEQGKPDKPKWDTPKPKGN